MSLPKLRYGFTDEFAIAHAPGVHNWVYRGDRILVSRWLHDALTEDPEQRPPHVHNDLEQISIILQGVAESQVGDQVAVTPAGSVYHVPAGTPHKIQRVNREPLVILDIFSGVAGHFAVDFPARAMNRADLD